MGSINVMKIKKNVSLKLKTKFRKKSCHKIVSMTSHEREASNQLDPVGSLVYTRL